jgi:protein Hikeshi
MDAPEESIGGGDITLGISLESAESVSTQMAALHPASNSQALVQVNRGGQGGQATGGKTDTLVLAQRIIKNAFNFLASFSGNVNGGVEVVPLKAFEEWWRKFEGRVRNDPGFLERDGD